jgi:hypothetical protein
LECGRKSENVGRYLFLIENPGKSENARKIETFELKQLET